MVIKLICKLDGDKIWSWYVNWIVMKLICKLDSDEI